MMDVLDERLLKDDEALEPLDDKHYIIQSKTGYRFGSDAVALAKFAGRFVTNKSQVVDLCSGCGIIAILLAIEKGCLVKGVERDEMLYSMSVRSAKRNKLDNAWFYNYNAAHALDFLNPRAYDTVVCNPPFYKGNSRPSKVAPEANCELTIFLKQIVLVSSDLLKQGGSLCMVHTTTRMDEVLACCREHGLTPKEVVLNKNCKTFLLRAVRGGKDGMTISVSE